MLPVNKSLKQDFIVNVVLSYLICFCYFCPVKEILRVLYLDVFVVYISNCSCFGILYKDFI